MLLLLLLLLLPAKVRWLQVWHTLSVSLSRSLRHHRLLTRWPQLLPLLLLLLLWTKLLRSTRLLRVLLRSMLQAARLLALPLHKVVLQELTDL